jgi:hypothetical protein
MSYFAGTHHNYLASVVAFGKHYGLAVDRYSVGIVIWEIMASEEALSDIMNYLYVDRVLWKGFRPKLGPRWPEPLQHLIRSSWQVEPVDNMSSMRSVPLQLQLMRAVLCQQYNE